MKIGKKNERKKEKQEKEERRKRVIGKVMNR